MGKQKLDNDFFEVVIIYNMLTDPRYLGSLVDTLEPRFFKDTQISSIVDIINNFFIRRNTAPTITEIKAHLDTPELKETFKQVVGQFKDIDQRFNSDELYDNTEKFIKEKSVYYTMLDVADDCQAGNIDTANILDRFEKACSVNLTGGIGLEFFSDIDTHIADLQKEEKYIPSTWEWLDRKLGGGFLETGKSLYLFAGATNIGKSIFLGNIATNVAAQGKTVVLVSLEMSELMYAKRVSTSISQIPISDLTGNPDTVKQKIESYKDTHPKSKLIIKEFPPNAVSATQLGAFLQKLIHQGIKPDLVVLDYINLLYCPTGNNSYERIKYASEQIRALSYAYSCPIITATQINRSGLHEHNPGVENISESIGLAATADCIMSIWQEDEDTELGIIRMGMIKNRYGQNFGSTEMDIDYTTLTLSESESINNTEQSAAIDRTLRALVED